MDHDSSPPNNPIHSALVEEEARESKNRTSNTTPRFSPGTKVHERTPSAKHHSLSMPKTVAHTNSDEPDRFIPGAYPEDNGGQSKKGLGVDSQLPSKEKPSGSNVGVGSLPGYFNEPGVATLPEERIDGRPYGSGHTGFEETLGNRTTFVPNASPAKSKIDPHELSALNKNAPTNTYTKTEEQKPASLATQHPLSNSPEISMQPGAAGMAKMLAGKVEETLPGLAQGTGNVLSAAIHAGGQFLGVAAGALPKVRQETGGALNVAGTVLGSMEQATVDTVHGAQYMLSDIGEGAKSYMPNVGTYFGGGGEETKTPNSATKTHQPFKPRPPLDSSNSIGSFVTSGVDAPNSRSRSRLDLAHSDTGSVQLNSSLATPSSESGITSSPQPYTLPNVVRREYARSDEYDLDGEKINTDNFLYENDISSSDNEDGVLHAHHHHHHQHHHNGDHIQDSEVPNVPARDTPGYDNNIVEGAGGVTYYRSAKDGKLPSFPTEAGMKQLISDRIKEDKNREAVTGPIDLEVADYGYPSSARRKNEGDDSSSQPDWTDSELEDRNVEEKKEVPVFISGGTGKFEAVFQPASEQPDPDTLQSQHSVREKSITMGKPESSLNPQAPPFVAHSSKAASGQTTATPGYLGKPVSDAEINSEVEQARLISSRKLGVN